MNQKDSQIKYTKYEKARLIGARALQIGMGAPFLLKLGKKRLEEINYSPVEIAKMEFNKGILPITIKRPLPFKSRKNASDFKKEPKVEKIRQEIKNEKEKQMEPLDRNEPNAG